VSEPESLQELQRQEPPEPRFQHQELHLQRQEPLPEQPVQTVPEPQELPERFLDSTSTSSNRSKQEPKR
jgi:hypothetical protein